MASVVWERRPKIEAAQETIPTLKEAASNKDFRPPTTIESDFERLLEHDIPHVNYTFELIHDWYASREDGYEPIYIRAQQTPIDWKSKIGNSDMSTNFKVTHKIPIYKGDMAIREDGAIFILNWNVQNHPNNQASQSIECNGIVSFERNVEAETDEEGYLSKDAGVEIVAADIPCVHEEYAGRPDYATAQGTLGISADHLITVSLQWNKQTKNIRINDEFVIGAFTYRVINISIAEVHIDKDRGILKVNAKRVAGGGIVEEV